MPTRTWMRWSFVLAVVCTSTASWAGLRQPAPLGLSIQKDGTGWASGSPADVRSDPDDTEFIGCGVYTFSGSTFAYCNAGHSPAPSLSCTTFDPKMIDAIRALASDSRIWFSVTNAPTGDCAAFEADTASTYGPKLP
jgi:hypothetical protein